MQGRGIQFCFIHSPAIAILPEGMSQERFDWLKSINAEIVKTPDSESSIKGVLDECNKMVKEGKGKIFTLNQFSDFSNPICIIGVPEKL